jgi:hypothetical protein
LYSDLFLMYSFLYRKGGIWRRRRTIGAIWMVTSGHGASRMHSGCP